jgi:hypothetical protein
MSKGRVLVLVALIGFFAVVTRADATSTVPINDPTFHFNDPTCVSGPDCLVLTYTGPTGFVPILTFLTPTPDLIPVPLTPPPTTYSCSSNVFLLCEVLDNGFFCPTKYFCGVSYQLGFLTAGETVTLSSNEPLPAFVLPADLVTPEPTTALLFVTGLLLLFLVGFARKRLGANLVT